MSDVRFLSDDETVDPAPRDGGCCSWLRLLSLEGGVVSAGAGGVGVVGDSCCEWWYEGSCDTGCGGGGCG